MAESGLDLDQLAKEDPLVHPAVASVQLFNYSTSPGDHLIETYNALWKAVDPDFPHAPTRVSRLLPRGHAKTEGVGIVFPTWKILDQPNVRAAVISKTKGLAGKRTEKIVNMVEHWAPSFGIDVVDSSKQELTTAAGEHHKEPTISPWGLESNLTGNHFDIIVYDDIIDWDNQRTEKQRQNVRNYFSDYVDNLPSNDSVLPNGPVQAYIGTRKHPQDVCATHILSSKTWDAEIYRAIHPDDWWIVEQRAWSIRGSDGELYDSVADLPEGVKIAQNGVIPDVEMRVLWPELKPPEALCYDIVDGDDSTAVWQRENQQDPDALSGEVFTPEMLHYVDGLPSADDGDVKPLTWVAGLDLGLIEDPQKAAEKESDYTALAIIGVDYDTERAYLDYLARERGLSVKGIKDWVVKHVKGHVDGSPGYNLTNLLVEQNAGRGPGQRLRNDTDIPAENISSTGDKHARIHNLSADFESSRLRINGDPAVEPWKTFEENEWVQFPTSAHDDMLDATELGMRAVGFGSVPTATATVGDDTRRQSRTGNKEFEQSPIGQALRQRRDALRGFRQ